MFYFMLRIPARNITPKTYIPAYLEYTLDMAPGIMQLATSPANPSMGLGSLERLPTEIIGMILAEMDLASLINFRSINQQTFNAVESIPVFKTLSEHAPHVIRCILSIGTGEWSSCNDLFDKFCTSECDHCGELAGYFYVLGPVQRVCFYCFTHSKAYCPLSLADARRRFRLPVECLTDIPKMRCLPGLYGENTIARDLTAGSAIDATPIPFPDSISLLDQNATHRKAIMFHGRQSAIETHLARQRLTSLAFPQPTSSANNHSLRQQGIDDSNSWRRLTTRVASEHETVDYHVGNIKRWMAVIKVPYYNKQTRLTEEGFCCRACSNLAGRRGYWRRRFNSQTWDDHIREYGEIVGSKHVSPTLPNPSGNAAAVGA